MDSSTHSHLHSNLNSNCVILLILLRYYHHHHHILLHVFFLQQPVLQCRRRAGGFVTRLDNRKKYRSPPTSINNWQTLYKAKIVYLSISLISHWIRFAVTSLWIDDIFVIHYSTDENRKVLSLYGCIRTRFPLSMRIGIWPFTTAQPIAYAHRLDRGNREFPLAGGVGSVKLMSAYIEVTRFLLNMNYSTSLLGLRWSQVCIKVISNLPAQIICGGLTRMCH